MTILGSFYVVNEDWYYAFIQDYQFMYIIICVVSVIELIYYVLGIVYNHRGGPREKMEALSKRLNLRIF